MKIIRWLLFVGIATMIYLIAAMLTMEEPYDFDYELIRPSQPFKQMIWDVNYRGA